MQKKEYNLIFSIVAGVIMLGIIILAVVEKRKNNLLAIKEGTAINDTTIIFDSIKVVAPILLENEVWNYSEHVDQMDGKKSFFASVNSTNEVNFNSPYDGGSFFTLTLQKQKGKISNITFSVSKGQILSHSEKFARIKIDKEKPFYVSISGTSDYKPDVIFLNSAQKIIQKLLKAKKIIVEAEFYQEGNQQAEFDVKDLIWNHS